VVDRHRQLAGSAVTDEFGARSAFHVAIVPTRRPGGRDAAREQERHHLRGGGGIGGGVARTFAREGAKVFLAGRTGPPMEAVAADIKAAGGSAEVAVLDATDERAVDAHLEAVAAGAGSVDVSLNLISRGDVQRTPLVDMTTDDLLRAVVTGLQSNFLTAWAAARRMTRQGSGVILHLNSASGAGAMPGMAAPDRRRRHRGAHAVPGGRGRPSGCASSAATPPGVVETLTKEGLDEVGGEGTPDPETVERMIAGMAMLRRAPQLAQVADVAAFLASDRASGMTATMANVTCGLVPG
jgi:NAD(P)-dependent dehydrogenase (short-subunit alcohol dehydrogenase family)